MPDGFRGKFDERERLGDTTVKWRDREGKSSGIWSSYGDGLDEVPKADRDSLLAGIGEYRSNAERQFLISSHIAEYAALVG